MGQTLAHLFLLPQSCRRIWACDSQVVNVHCPWWDQEDGAGGSSTNPRYWAVSCYQNNLYTWQPTPGTWRPTRFATELHIYISLQSLWLPSFWFFIFSLWRLKLWQVHLLAWFRVHWCQQKTFPRLQQILGWAPDTWLRHGPRGSPIVLTYIQPYAFPIWESPGSSQGWLILEDWLLESCWAEDGSRLRCSISPSSEGLLPAAHAQAPL